MMRIASGTHALHRSILLVEDDIDLRDALRDGLTSLGHRVTTATDGEEAFQEMTVVLPDVIVLDLMMPGMNGWQFRDWQRTQARLAKVPVVLLSAVRNLEDEAKKLDVADYLEKPITFPALVKAVEKFCGPCKETG